MKWLCDEMLRGLGKWLRVAGYDTVVADNGERDRELIQQACCTERILLTRDRKMVEIRNARRCVYLLLGNSLEEWICQLNQEYGIDWQTNSFSRCLLCNVPLQETEDQDWKRVPEESREMSNSLMICPTCKRLYWEGTHVRRMRNKLSGFQALCKG